MREGWHLDRKVPLSIIIAILIQTSALIVWGAKLDGRVAHVETSINTHAFTIEAMKNTQNTINIGLARIEERQIITAEGVREIKAKLDDKQK